MSATPITWNDPSTAVTLLEPLVNASGYVDNVLVRCDPTNVHYQSGPLYRLGRFTTDSNGQPVWLWRDADRVSELLPLYGCVNGFALAELPA